ncbi:MAG: LemA family protein [Spirochaetes bacterium]|uniref:LemA family protein n=1 Tax=Candidatus Ornithospirochaeta stercoravium TaxID=2840897 RepID=A0A9D9NDF2_9SPIO|nr:LemA family protein [Candidatus Ornithospirochaeta stercoravium]
MAFIIAAVIIALIIIWAIASYNSLVKLRNKGDEAESAIDAHLKERADLIPNLVETVKGYASHEAETLENAISARNRASGKDRASAENEISGVLGHLFAVAESYPDLKANQNFLDLQRQLSRIEEELRNARKYFNAIVREYNDKIMVFPSSLIASAFHFTKRDYYEVDDEDRKRVEVRF